METNEDMSGSTIKEAHELHIKGHNGSTPIDIISVIIPTIIASFMTLSLTERMSLR